MRTRRRAGQCANQAVSQSWRPTPSVLRLLHDVAQAVGFTDGTRKGILVSLTAVECEGYMAFAKRTRLDLRQLTVVFGRNNSGKTTLARLPVFLASSLASSAFYSLEALGITFGSSFPGLASLDQPHPRISLGLEWTQRHRLAATLQNVASADGRESVELLAVDIDGTVYERALSSPRMGLGGISTGFMGKNEGALLEERRRELRALLEGVVHVPSARPAVTPTYTTRDPNTTTVDEVPYLLASNHTLLGAVDQWFRDELEIGTIEVDKAAFAFRLAAQEGAVSVNLASAGRGTQAVLPVATILLGVATGQLGAQLVIVEEPEAHLHPSAHGALADLAIHAASRAQVLVETHSENFILRVRRRVAEGRLGPDKLRLIYVDGGHLVSEVALDAAGGTDNWPHGVFESDIEEAEAIVRAKLEAFRGAQR